MKSRNYLLTSSTIQKCPTPLNLRGNVFFDTLLPIDIIFGATVQRRFAGIMSSILAGVTLSCGVWQPASVCKHFQSMIIKFLKTFFCRPFFWYFFLIINYYWYFFPVRQTITDNVPPFFTRQLTFELGLTHYDLADLGLNTLEKWNTQSVLHNTDSNTAATVANTTAGDEMKELLYEVLPSLDDYLRSELNENGKDTRARNLTLSAPRPCFAMLSLFFFSQRNHP